MSGILVALGIGVVAVVFGLLGVWLSFRRTGTLAGCWTGALLALAGLYVLAVAAGSVS